MKPLTMYDPCQDEFREVTQDDFDFLAVLAECEHLARRVLSPQHRTRNTDYMKRVRDGLRKLKEDLDA